MNFFSALYTLITAVPALVKLVIELASWLNRQFGDNPAKFITDSAAVFERAKNAKTPQEKQAAAAEIAVLLRRL